MVKIKIAEINMINLLIVLYVGTMGVISLFTHSEQVQIATVSGLLGYMGRYIQETHKSKTGQSVDGA